MPSIEDWSDALADRMSDGAAHLTNEEELRLHAQSTIVEAAQELFELDPLKATAERRPKKGLRYDNLYGGVVVEYEWNMRRARREHGAQQALDYLAAFRETNGDDSAFTAVVTDGLQWGFLVEDPGASSTLFDVDPATAAERFDWRPNGAPAARRFLELIGAHRKVPLTGAGLRSTFGPSSDVTRRLVKLLLEAIAGRSKGDRSDVLYCEWRRALDVVYGDLDSKVNGLANVVASAYDVRVDREVGEYLFVLHSTFAFIARMTGLEILAIATDDRDLRPTSWLGLPNDDLAQALQDADDGALPGGLEVQNLFEADVFGWWSAILSSDVDLLNAVRDTLGALGQFAFPRVVHGPQVATDVLSELYQSLVPAALRKQLGEFLTPRWLADACLERLVRCGANLATGRLIDPTCGTGTFLVPVLNSRLAKLRRDESTTSQDVQLVLNGVAGIDINPVAVIAARVNFVLVLGRLAALGPISLQIWRADSLLVPDAPPAQGLLGDLAGRTYREITTSLPESFPIPPLLATAARISALRELLESGIRETLDDGLKLVLDGMEVEFGPHGRSPITSDAAAWSNEVAVAEVLFRRIWKLHADGVNGVWAQIIANSYSPLFAGTYETVVGNPPWLAWGKLPAGWRSGSERLWRKFGLWKLPREPGDTGGIFQVSDLAQLVFAVAIERYAGSAGYVGLLTPDSLLIANPGARAFRRCRLVTDSVVSGVDPVDIPFRVHEIDDWSEIKPFAPLAANKPVFIVAQRDSPTTFPIPAHRWSRGIAGARVEGDWTHVRGLLHDEPGELTPAHPTVHTSAWSFRPTSSGPMIQGGTNGWAFGTGLHTRGANGIFFVKIRRCFGKRGMIEIENLPEAGRHRDVTRATGRVEAASVFPLLRGRDVTPWVARPSSHIVFAHDPADVERPMAAKALARGGDYEMLGNWLRRHRKVLASRAAPPRRSWDLGGDDWVRLEGPFAHMRAGHLVVVREIAGAPAAAIAERRWNDEIERTEVPLIEHKLLFCSVSSLDEAVYLTAFINSTPAQDFLKSFTSEVGVTPKALRTLPVPPYDPLNPDVWTLVTSGGSVLAAAYEDRATVAQTEQAVMDEAVLRLAKYGGSYSPQVRRVPATRKRTDLPDAPTLPF